MPRGFHPTEEPALERVESQLVDPYAIMIHWTELQKRTQGLLAAHIKRWDTQLQDLALGGALLTCEHEHPGAQLCRMTVQKQQDLVQRSGLLGLRVSRQLGLHLPLFRQVITFGAVPHA